MKRLALLLLTMTVACTLAAQPVGKPNPFHRHKPAFKPIPSPTIIVQAQNTENFYVYLNGDLINETPRSQVVIDRLDDNLHEVIIVLNQPARKAIVMEVYADISGTILTVDYSHRNNQLTVTAPENRMAVPVPQVVSDEWVDEMVGILNDQSFDTERSQTAKGLLNNGLPFTTNQIARIASTFSFSTGKVEFLKLAYTHCINPENYERALAVLTFSNDRQEVRDYINSLH